MRLCGFRDEFKIRVFRLKSKIWRHPVNHMLCPPCFASAGDCCGAAPSRPCAPLFSKRGMTFRQTVRDLT